MAFAPIMMAVSAGVQALGAIYEGNAAAAQSSAAANWSEANARNTRLQTDAREEMQRRRNAMLLGELRASSAQTGFDPSSGGLASLQSHSAAQLELDALTNRYSGELQAISLDNEAATYRSRAKAQRKTGYLTAAGSVLNAVGNYYGAPKLPSGGNLTEYAGGGLGNARGDY